jgi:thiamine kinase-like enzyme
VALKVEEVIARVPQFAGAREIKTIRLSGGITNENIRAIVDGESYVLRRPGENGELLGINREHEYTAALAAAAIGIAPEVIRFIRPEGWLVTRFIEGKQPSPEEMRDPRNIARVADALRRIHSLGPLPAAFSSFRTVGSYTDIARRHRVPLPAAFSGYTRQMIEIESALSRNRLPDCPCHNDLLNGNFLDDGEIRILDWEYSGMGDLFFDLGNFCVNHDFGDREEQDLLEKYFGRVAPEQWARLKLMKIMSDFREAMWGLVQSGISALDFDFIGYAKQHFARMEDNLNDPRYEQFLREALGD